MTLPSSPESLPLPSAESPRGIWTARFPAPGVHARLQGVTSAGVELVAFNARSEDDVAVMGAFIVAILDRLDPVDRPRLALVPD